MWKMFSTVENSGWVNKRPRFIAVQPDGCAPVVKAYNSKRDDVDEWKNPKTIAFGLRIPKPLAGKWILRCLRESDGIALLVTEDRKSTRLNSSHSQISYAVFCLKKKNK